MNLTVVQKARARRALLRWNADMMALWGFCGNAACRRARACRGDAATCYGRYARLLPDAAREGAEILFDGWLDERPFDLVHDEALEEVDALTAWVNAVHEANAPRPARQATKKAGR